MGQGPHSEVLLPMQAVTDREEDMEVEGEETGGEEMEVDVEERVEDMDTDETDEEKAMVLG